MDLHSVCVLVAVGLVTISKPVLAAEIYVDSDGVSNTTCCPNSSSEGPTTPCKTLTLALQCVHVLPLMTNVTVIVNEGNYTLTNESNLTLIEGRSGGFSMVGNCSDRAVCVKIDCETSAGLSFIRSDFITLQNLSFFGCSRPNNSTSQNFLIGVWSKFQQVNSALYFLLCRSVTLAHVTVQETHGTGVVMYSTVGTNTITNSKFVSNKPPDEQFDRFTGGGGLYIEFAYCYPGNTSCIDGPSNIPEDYTKDSKYFITDSVFAENVANISDSLRFTFILPQKANHVAFGRGGGLSVFIKGSATNNVVSIDRSEFYNNTALWGSGLFVEVQDDSTGNSVYANNTKFFGNECLFKESGTQGTGGGGSRLGFIFFNDTHAKDNSIGLENCVFLNNSAFFGGGVSFYAAREPSESSSTNTLAFLNTSFERNVARAGSAVDLSVWHSVPMGATATVNFTDCTFQENNGSYTTEQGSAVGIGGLYLDGISVYFMGEILFLFNTNSALAATSAGIYIMSNATVNFTSNCGRHGAGVALLGAAFIQVHPFSKAMFVNNSAEIAGGAIYQNSIGEHDLINSRNCFIRYSDIKTLPRKWNTTFLFTNNSADGRNESIFASSLIVCQWGGAFGNASGNLSEVFCWSGNWKYSSNCKTEVRTLPAHFKPSNKFKLEIFPGQRRSMHLKMLDDHHSDVTDSSVFNAKSLSQSLSVDSSSEYISDNHIEVHSGSVRYNSEVHGTVLLETIDPRVMQVKLNVTVFQCPPGMILVGENSSASCQCGQGYEGIILCNATGFYTYIQRGSWIGLSQHRGKQEVIASSTPYFDLTSTSQFIKLPRKISELNKALCGSVNRTGTLCGKCQKGFGPSLHTHKCVKCDTKYTWALYFLSQYVPLTILFILVTVLDIRVTSAPANAFIFFAQVLPFVFTLDGGGVIALSHTSNYFVDVYTFLYRIWNLQFFQLDICISPHMESLEAISLTYLEAAYPLLLIALVSSIITLYEKGFRCILCICRPFHFLLARFQQNWNIRRSLIHAFASFVLLSYSRFVLVSFLLLTTTPLLKDDGSTFAQVVYYDGTIPFFTADHLPFALLSLVVLVIFAFITPILLIVPSFFRNLGIVRRKWPKVGRYIPSFSQCTVSSFPKLNPFLEAFHGFYKDGTNTTRKSTEFDYRWCAGFYLILRLALFAVYAFTPDWFMQYSFLQFFCIAALLLFVLLRPYKQDFYNKLDATMFALLLGINTLTMYNYNRVVISSKPSLIAFSIQYVLVLLPLIYISVVISKHLVLNMYACCKKRRRTPTLIDDTERERLVNGLSEDGPLTQSGSRDYLSFMEQTGRLDNVNVYRPASATDDSREQSERNSSEIDSGNCPTQSSSSANPTPVSSKDGYHEIEGHCKSQEFDSLPPSKGSSLRDSSEGGRQRRPGRGYERSVDVNYHLRRSSEDEGTGSKGRPERNTLT